MLNAKFDRVLMAQGSAANGVVAHARSDRGVIQTLRVEGRMGARAPFLRRSSPTAVGVGSPASIDDAGEPLRGLDYVSSMQGGKLSVQAQHDDAQPDRPLIGTANIEQFRIRDAPAFGKLLQAMTLH